MTSDSFTITDQQRDYSQYSLDENPFPYFPVITKCFDLPVLSRIEIVSLTACVTCCWPQ